MRRWELSLFGGTATRFLVLAATGLGALARV